MRDFELRDWLAFGSGCRSRASSPGDVELQLSEDPTVRGTYRLHFTLSHYGIAPSEPLLTQVSTFARECGIRLAIYPKPGLKLIDVAGRPIYRVDKGLGPEVRLRSRLFIGDAAIGLFEKLFTAKQSVLDQQEEVLWQPREDAISIFERVDCEQPKIVGLDLSVAVMRDRVGEEAVTATLNQGEFDLTLKFAACSSAKKGP